MTEYSMTSSPLPAVNTEISVTSQPLPAVGNPPVVNTPELCTSEIYDKNLNRVTRICASGNQVTARCNRTKDQGKGKTCGNELYDNGIVYKMCKVGRKMVKTIVSECSRVQQ
jgi:hypothetical protein